MKKDDWLRDFRRVDEIVIRAGSEVQENDEHFLILQAIYWLSVAVWHLLEDKIKK